MLYVVRCCLAALPLSAGGVAEHPIQEKPAAHELKEAVGREIRTVAALRLLREVAPDRAQASVIAEAVRRAARIEEKTRVDRDRIEVALLDALKAFRDEAEADRGFTPEVETAAARANRELEELEDLTTRQLNLLGQQVRSILRPEQREVVEVFDPYSRAGELFRGPAAGDRWDEASRLLRRARSLGPEAFEKKRDHLAQRLLLLAALPPSRRERSEATPPSNPSTPESVAVSVLEEARSLSPTEFERCEEDLLARLAPDGALRLLQRELREVRARKRVQLDSYACYLLDPDLLPALERLAGERPLGKTTNGEKP